MRKEIKDYLNQKLDKDKKIYFRNLFLKYNNVDGKYKKGFTIFLDGRTESARSLYRDKNNHEIINRMIEKAEKKLNYKGTISWKKAQISDFENIWDVAGKIDDLIDIRYKRIKEREMLNKANDDFL
jgi:hypothetical protein